jgi:hypothetical protein
MGVDMNAGIFHKKLLIIGLICAGTVVPGHAMQEGPRQGYFNRLYEWWKRVGNRDFTLYAFPVAKDQGNYYLLVNQDGTPFSMPIQHRPHRDLFPSPQIGITTTMSPVPGLNVYWAKGRPMVGWGDVHQYYKERNQAYMAETLVEDKTGGCFKKGAGIQIDDNWFWGGQLNYTKRACFMNRNMTTKQDENIVVFLKATYKLLNNCKNKDGSPAKLQWVPMGTFERDEAQQQRFGVPITREKWLELLLQYWRNKPYDTGGYRLGAQEKLWGKQSATSPIVPGQESFWSGADPSVIESPISATQQPRAQILRIKNKASFLIRCAPGPTYQHKLIDSGKAWFFPLNTVSNVSFGYNPNELMSINMAPYLQEVQSHPNKDLYIEIIDDPNQNQRLNFTKPIWVKK